MVREARLKTEYAALYPWLRPGAWHPAALVADRLAAVALVPAGRAGMIRAGRLLDDQHFDFRGGPERPKGCATRAGEW